MLRSLLAFSAASGPSTSKARRDRLADGTPDPLVLEIAATEGRILVSHDVRTMPSHFRRFLAEHGQSPGLLLISQTVFTAEAIDELVMLWAISEAEEWQAGSYGSPFSARRVAPVAHRSVEAC